MNPNEIQGRWILSQGWLPAQTVEVALRKVQAVPGTDLCGFLVQLGQITREQADLARQTAIRALQSQAPLQNQSPAKQNLGAQNLGAQNLGAQNLGAQVPNPQLGSLGAGNQVNPGLNSGGPIKRHTQRLNRAQLQDAQLHAQNLAHLRKSSQQIPIPQLPDPSSTNPHLQIPNIRASNPQLAIPDLRSSNPQMPVPELGALGDHGNHGTQRLHQSQMQMAVPNTNELTNAQHSSTNPNLLVPEFPNPHANVLHQSGRASGHIGHASNAQLGIPQIPELRASNPQMPVPEFNNSGDHVTHRLHQSHMQMAAPTDPRLNITGTGAHAPLPKTEKKLGAVGTVFAGYQVLEEISRGAMGVIVKALHLASQREVALKFMLQTTPDEKEIGRFQLEAEALIRLKHENIIEITDFGVEHGHLFFAMVLIHGKDLRSLVEQSIRRHGHPPPWNYVVPMAISVAEALDYSHKQRVLHRDVKPRNILVEDSTGRAILVDFGLNKKEQRNDTSAGSSNGLTRSDEVVGTPEYMSPEQFLPNGPYGKIGEKTDVWGLGITLYYCLTGTSPFQKPSIVEMYEAIIKVREPRLSKLNQDVPEWLEQIIADCMEKNTKDRPSMTVLKKRLQKGLEREIREQNPNRSRTPLVVGVALVTLLPLLLLIVPQLTRRPTRFLKVSCGGGDQSWTHESQVKVKGQLSHGNAVIKVNGKRQVQSDDKGRFHFQVELNPGPNALVFLVDNGQHEPAVEKVTIYRDNKKPELIFHPSHRITPSGAVVLGEDLRLKAKIRDDSPDKVLIGTESIAFGAGEDGQFEITVKDSSKPILKEFRAWDRAGNELRTKVTLLSPKAHRLLKKQNKKQNNKPDDGNREPGTRPKPGSGRKPTRSGNWRSDLGRMTDRDRLALKQVQDIEVWRKLDRAEQIRVAKWLEQRLGSAYEFLELGSFRSHNQRIRIARYRHRRSSLEFHLIPGSVQNFTDYSRDPEAELYKHWLKALKGLEIDSFDVKDILLRAPEFLAECLRTALNLPKDAQDDAILDALGQDSKKYRHAQSELIRRLSAKLMPTVRPLKINIAPFLLAKSELGEEEWNRLAGREVLIRGDMGSMRPMRGMSYEACFDWCQGVGDGFRLPTAFEWLSVCRLGGLVKIFSDTPKELKKHSWLANNSGAEPHAVNERMNATEFFGLTDLVGNVAEWVEPPWLLDQCKMPGRYSAERFQWRMVVGAGLKSQPRFANPLIFEVLKTDQKRADIGLRVALSLP